jgi:hypothetical protein
MLARFFLAVRIQAERVVCNFKALTLRDFDLQGFNFCVVKLFHTAAIEAHQMVVVFALIQLIHRTFALKVAARQDVGLFELHQDAVHRG